LDARREVNHCFVKYGNVPVHEVDEDGDPIGYSKQIREASTAYRNLAAEMCSFAYGEYYANAVVNWLGYDPDKIATALIAYSNQLITPGLERANWRSQIEKLLKIKAEE